VKQVADRYQSALPRIKASVRSAHDYFKENFDRYNEFTRFVCESNLTGDEVTLLQTMGRPQLEFNTLASRVARLLGEFAKAEPDIMVTADDEDKVDWMTLKVVEQHLRHVLLDIDNHHTRFEVYKDLLVGGFSVLKVYTDYASSMSMDQVIKFDRAEPTLCVFDKLARQSHKGDGMYCAELFPKSKDEFEVEYPDVSLSTVSFKRNFSGFQWSYINDNSEIILLADYYEKKKQEKTIVQVRDGRVMEKSEYDKMVREWNDITVPPAIIGKPRKTIVDKIVRYRCIENQVLEYEETDYNMLPLVFVDGSSTLVRNHKNGNIKQVCLPYVYHAKGAQRLKNFAGIALANEIESQVQHKVMVAKEALPKEEGWLDAYKDVQKASNYVFNAFYEENPDQPIPNPIREVQRVPAPPEIVQAFTGADSLMEQILGSYDAALGINNNQLSGVAIIEGATQSNSAAMPYVVGFMQGLQRASEIYVDLLPKYYATPRTVPIMDEEGKRNFIKINQEDGLPFDFDANALNVVVKAGASFQVQKSRTINMVKEIMGISPQFAEFINTKGLNFVLDNLEGKGIEQLKAMVDAWQQEQEAQKQKMMQMQEMQAQQNPAMMKMQVEMQKLAHEKERDKAQFMVDMKKIEAEEAKAEAQLELGKTSAEVQVFKALTERRVHEIDAGVRIRDQAHKHVKDAFEFHHRTRKKPEHEERNYE